MRLGALTGAALFRLLPMRKPNKNRIADDAITHADMPNPRSVQDGVWSVMSDAGSLVATRAAAGGVVSDAAVLMSGVTFSLAVASTFSGGVGVFGLLVSGSEVLNA